MKPYGMRTNKKGPLCQSIRCCGVDFKLARKRRQRDISKQEIKDAINRLVKFYEKEIEAQGRNQEINEKLRLLRIGGSLEVLK